MRRLWWRLAVACWPPEILHRRRIRRDVDAYEAARFWRRARLVTRVETRLVDAANNNRRAAMRAALHRQPAR